MWTDENDPHYILLNPGPSQDFKTGGAKIKKIKFLEVHIFNRNTSNLEEIFIKFLNFEVARGLGPLKQKGGSALD